MYNSSNIAFKVAAVQAGPVYMDLQATVKKACEYILEAGKNGAKLVAFPESYIPAYPYWARYLNSLEAAPYTKELIKQSMTAPGPETKLLGEAAAEAGCYVVVGINEVETRVPNTIYNTNLMMDDKGAIISKHRKLVPTYCEKLVWAYGDANGLEAVQTNIGRIGNLMCGENSNSLARFVLIADGEQIHVANYYSLPKGDKGGYNLAKDIEIRSAAHSFEGKLFNVVPSSVINESTIEYYKGHPVMEEIMKGGTTGYTGIWGANGYQIAGPLPEGKEDILYADINLDDAILPKLRHDIAGNYNRFDLMHVVVNRRRSVGLSSVDESGALSSGKQEIEAEGKEINFERNGRII